MTTQKKLNLILNGEDHFRPLYCERIFKIKESIVDQIYSDPKHQYVVQSNVTEPVFKSFLNYLFDEIMPDIQKDNISEYDLLYREFGVFHDIILEKKKEWKYFEDINDLLDPTINDKSTAEEMIAARLDDYLENEGEKLMKAPIHNLINIFKHKERKLARHNLAYELILKQYEQQPNDKDIFVLLPFIDGLQLSEKNFKDAVCKKKERFDMIPKIEYQFFDKIKNDLKDFKEEQKNANDANNSSFSRLFALFEATSKRIGQIEEQMNDQKKQISNKISQVENKLNDQIKNQILQCEQKINKQINDKINQSENKTKKLINDQVDQVNTKSNEKINNSITQLESKMNDQINNQIKQSEKEIKKLINDQVDQVNTKSNEKINNDIKQLESKMNDQINKQIKQSEKVTEETINKKLDHVNNTFDKRISNDILKVENKMNGQINSQLLQFEQKINKQINDQINQSENKTKELFDDQIKDVNTKFNEKINNDIMQMEGKMNDQISKQIKQSEKETEEKINKKINHVNNTFDKRINDDILKVENKMNYSIKQSENKTNELFNKKTGQIQTDINEKIKNEILQIEKKTNDSISKISDETSKKINKINEQYTEINNNLNEQNKRQNLINTNQKALINKNSDLLTQIETRFNKNISDVKVLIKQNYDHQKQSLASIKEQSQLAIDKMKNDIESMKNKENNDYSILEKLIKSQTSNSNKVIQFLKEELEKGKQICVSNKKNIELFQKNFDKQSKSTEEKLNKHHQNILENFNSTKKNTNLLNKMEREIDNYHILSTLIFNLIEKPNLISPFNSELSFYIPFTQKGEGILSLLKKQTKDIFSPSFIVKKSSFDCYNLLIPNVNDRIQDTNLTIEFRFRYSKKLNGIEIETSNKYTLRSFNIIINDKVIIKIKNDTNLKDAPHKARYNFPETECNIVKIVQTGPNWDQNPQTNYVSITNIDFFSVNDPNGLINFLNKVYAKKDPHLFPDSIKCSHDSTENIQELSSTKSICTNDGKNEFFTIEFIGGVVSIEGYRLKRYSRINKMKGWKVVGKNLRDEEVILSEFVDNNRESDPIYTTQLKNKQPLFMKSITLYQTLQNWDLKDNLCFYHFDIFGHYIKI